MPPPPTQDSPVPPWGSDAVWGLLLQLVCHREAPPQCHAAHVHTGRAQQPSLLPAGTLITGVLVWREVPSVPLLLVLLKSFLVLQNESLKTEDGSVSSAAPDICIAYKLHLECGRLINLYDWLEVSLSDVWQYFELLPLLHGEVLSSEEDE